MAGLGTSIAIRRRPTSSDSTMAAAIAGGGDGRSTRGSARSAALSSAAMRTGSPAVAIAPGTPAISSALASPADRVAITDWTGWPGSKAAGGVAHRIIGQMPPHRTYCELFLGYGAIMRAKKPAEKSFGFDADPAVVRKWHEAHIAGFDVSAGDALQILSSFPPLSDPTTLLYLDPPYLRDVRTRLLYACEFATIKQHEALLGAIIDLPCMVMISHYWHRLYAKRLRTWRSISYQTMTRGGVRQEWLWMNFPEPAEFHDPRFCGDGFRDRERVKRKRARWVKRMAAMKPFERQIIREALDAAVGECK